MAINFNRSQAQVYIEQLIDASYQPSLASNEAKKGFKQKVILKCLTQTEALSLHGKLELDSKDYWYNGMISFFEGLNGLSQGNFSWATIQLYYSVFYNCRAYLAFKDICLFRATDMFCWTAKPNTSAVFGGREYNKTHEGSIRYFADSFPTHYILSNEIDGKRAVDWYKDLRDIINYRTPRFYEPSYLTVFEKFENKQKIEAAISMLCNDATGLEFIEDYAVVGIPLKFLLKMINELKLEQALLSEEELLYLKSIDTKSNLNLMNVLFNSNTKGCSSET